MILNNPYGTIVVTKDYPGYTDKDKFINGYYADWAYNQIDETKFTRMPITTTMAENTYVQELYSGEILVVAGGKFADLGNIYTIDHIFPFYNHYFEFWEFAPSYMIQNKRNYGNVLAPGFLVNM